MATLLQEVFLPQGYPDTVSSDYLSYQMWDTLQVARYPQPACLIPPPTHTHTHTHTLLGILLLHNGDAGNSGHPEGSGSGRQYSHAPRCHHHVDV